MTQLPAARTGNGTRVVRGMVLIGSIVVAIGAIIAGHAYKRPDPVADQPTPGMKSTCTQTPADQCKSGKYDAIELAPNAPQWSVVVTKAPDKAEPRWTEPIPARVVFDESRTSRLGAPLAGRVSAVFVERGQAVTAGSPLYSISSASLADLVANQSRAKVELGTAIASYDRTQRAVDAQVLPGKDLETAKQQLANAKLALELANQKLSSLTVTNGGGAAFTVTAPRSGVVVERSITVGETVSPDNGSLIAIADLSSVWVVADIFGSHLAGLAPGTRVRVSIGDSSEGDRDAVIDQISQVVDPDRHAIPVRIKLDNPDGLLRPNAYVQVRLFDPTPTKAMLPASAVMSDGSRSFVYIEQPTGVLKRRNIEVGSVIGGRVPVTEGLELTDKVVVQGAILIDNKIALDN